MTLPPSTVFCPRCPVRRWTLVVIGAEALFSLVQCVQRRELGAIRHCVPGERQRQGHGGAAGDDVRDGHPVRCSPAAALTDSRRTMELDRSLTCHMSQSINSSYRIDRFDRLVIN